MSKKLKKKTFYKEPIVLSNFNQLYAKHYFDFFLISKKQLIPSVKV